MMLTAENGVLGQRNSLVLNFSTTNLMQYCLLLKESLSRERSATVQVAARLGIAIIRSVDKQFTTTNLYLLETYLKTMSAARSMWNQNGGILLSNDV
jgi:hypothetical protein